MTTVQDKMGTTRYLTHWFEQMSNWFAQSYLSAVIQSFPKELKKLATTIFGSCGPDGVNVDPGFKMSHQPCSPATATQIATTRQQYQIYQLIFLPWKPRVATQIWSNMGLKVLGSLLCCEVFDQINHPTMFDVFWLQFLRRDLSFWNSLILTNYCRLFLALGCIGKWFYNKNKFVFICPLWAAPAEKSFSQICHWGSLHNFS